MIPTLKQAKGGNHCHMKVWQNAAVNITPLTSEPNYHTLEEMWILIFVILFGITVSIFQPIYL